MSAGTVTAICGAIAGIIVAVTGLVSALRAHNTINTEVKPAIKDLQNPPK